MYRHEAEANRKEAQKSAPIKRLESIINAAGDSQLVKDQFTMIVSSGWKSISYEDKVKTSNMFITEECRADYKHYFTTPAALLSDNLVNLSCRERLIAIFDVLTADVSII